MKKWTLLFDVDRCNGCCNCVLATMDEYVGNDHIGYADAMPRHGSPWLDMRVVERGMHPYIDVAYAPSTCQHCDNAPCVERFPEAVVRRDDGIVMIVPERARGNKAIVEACPVGAIHWNEEKQVAQNWNLDAHLLDAGWKEPRAAQACPTGALKVLKLADAEIEALTRSESLQQTDAARALGSRLYFKGMRRLVSQLIGGSAAITVEGRKEPLVDAHLELLGGDGSLASTRTDDFGNYRFDLGADPGCEITLVLHHQNHKYRRSVRKTNGGFRVGVMHVDPQTRQLRDEPQTAQNGPEQH